MRVLITLVTLLGLLPTTSSVPRVSKDGNHFGRKFSRGKEAIRVDIWRRTFRRGNHRIKLDHGQVMQVDGHPTMGDDGGPLEALKTEISRVRVAWNGTTVELQEDLYKDCLNANLAEGVTVKPSEDFRSVLIVLSGGDGAGAYEAYLVVSRDGFATRFLAGEGGLAGQDDL